MSKIRICLLVLLSITEIANPTKLKRETYDDDITPESNNPNLEYVAYFVKRDKGTIEALIGTSGNKRRSQYPNPIPGADQNLPWKSEWSPKQQRKWKPKWYKSEKRNCTNYKHLLRYCFRKLAPSSLSDQIYNLYLKTTKKNPKLGLLQNVVTSEQITELLTLSEQIAAFKFVDYLMVSKCLLSLNNKLTTTDFKNFLKIIDNLLNNGKFTFGFDLLRQKFETIFHQLHHNVLFNSPELIVLSWKPYDKNITGLALYQHTNRKPFALPIKIDQTADNIYTRDLEIAAYIHGKVIEVIGNHTTRNKKKNLFIKMLFIRKSEKYRQFFNLESFQSNIVGVTLPGFCKTNYLPLVNVFIKMDDRKSNASWVKFGYEYYDSKWSGSPCLLSRLSFFGHSSIIGNRYEESTKQSHCMLNSTLSYSSSIYWSVTPVGNVIFPEGLCLNEDLRIPVMDCQEGGVATKRKSLSIGCSHHATTPKTEFLYQSLVRCYRNVSSKDCDADWDLNVSDDLTYTDIELYLLLVDLEASRRSQVKFSNVRNLLNKAIELLADQGPSYKRISIANTFLRHVLHYRWPYKPNKILVQSKLIHVTFNPSHGEARGLVVLGNNEKSFQKGHAKLLTPNNATAYLQNQTHVEMFLEFSESFLESVRENGDVGDNIEIFVIHDNKFEENKHRCRSRLVWISNFFQDIALEFNLFLQTMHSKIGRRGMSSTFKVPSNQISVFCVSIEPGGKRPGNKIIHFTYAISEGDVDDSILLTLKNSAMRNVS